MFADSSLFSASSFSPSSFSSPPVSSPSCFSSFFSSVSRIDLESQKEKKMIIIKRKWNKKEKGERKGSSEKMGGENGTITKTTAKGEKYYIYIYIYIHTCACVCVCVYLHMHIDIFFLVCVCMYIIS